jgi:hypothetical protein
MAFVELQYLETVIFLELECQRGAQLYWCCLTRENNRQMESVGGQDQITDGGRDQTTEYGAPQ